MPKNIHNHQGFSIVELLFVIVVLGILTALVLNSVSQVQAKERDSARQSDIDRIATELEKCHEDRCNGAYPSLVALRDVATGGWVEANLPGFDTSVLYDVTDTLIQGNPPTSSAQLQYEPTDCTNNGRAVTDSCASYTLRTYQEQGSTYTKTSLY